MRSNVRKTNHARNAVLLSAAALVTLAGCTGHGKYTQEFKDQAELRMALIKAGTEWDMAHQQFLAGDLEKALKSIDRSIAINNEVLKSHVLRGRILHEMSRLEAAMMAFDRAIEIDPVSAEAHYYKGIIFERFSQPLAAEASYRAASEADPTNAQYLLARAETLIELGRYQEASRLLDGERSNFQHNAGIRQTLAHIAQIEGRIDDAVRLFSEAYLLAPDDPALLEDLARAQYNAAKFADAEYTTRRLLESPAAAERRDLIFLRARCLIELDRPVEARTLVQRLTKDARGGGDVLAWIELGKIACILKDQFQIREAGNRIVSIAPQRYEGYMLLGAYYRREGDLNAAVKTLNKAVELSTRDPAPAILQALAYSELGNTVAAARAAERAQVLAPDDPSVRQIRSLTNIANVPVGN